MICENKDLFQIDPQSYENLKTKLSLNLRGMVLIF